MWQVWSCLILIDIPTAQKFKMEESKKNESLVVYAMITFASTSIKAHAFWHFMESNCRWKIYTELCHSVVSAGKLNLEVFTET